MEKWKCFSLIFSFNMQYPCSCFCVENSWKTSVCCLKTWPMTFLFVCFCHFWLVAYANVYTQCLLMCADMQIQKDKQWTWASFSGQYSNGSIQIFHETGLGERKMNKTQKHRPLSKTLNSQVLGLMLAFVFCCTCRSLSANRRDVKLSIQSIWVWA